MPTENRDLLPADITANTSLVGLMGWPIGHSVSPFMHNAAFAALRMNWRYVPLPVAPDQVKEAVLGLRALSFRGANVTVPHKQTVMPILDRWSPAAEAIGAVNTIIMDDAGTLTGDNTDADGFIADLETHGVELGGQHALVIGAGGSARAIVYGLAQAGCADITILNRTEERAQTLVETMTSYFPDVALTAGIFPDMISDVSIDADLIVNCTSLGMAPKSEGLPWDEDVEFDPEQTVYDLVYNPSATRLLQLAGADGATAISGIGMLVHQGAIAFQRWTGEEAPVNVMRRAVNIVFDQ